MLIQRSLFKCGYLYPEIKSIKSLTLTVYGGLQCEFRKDIMGSKTMQVPGLENDVGLVDDQNEEIGIENYTPWRRENT